MTSALGASRAVLFDLDDTLYPERQFVDGGFRSVAEFLGRLSGRPPGPLAERLWELHRRDGRGRLFDTLAAELGLDGDPDIVPACLLVYRSHPVRLSPFEGVAALLDRLTADDVRIGLVSDGDAAVQWRKLAGLDDLAARFDVVVLTAELGPGLAKPSPVPFRVACRLLDVAPADAIYVGNDPAKDVAGARGAGLSTIRFGAPPDVGGGADPRAAPAVDADRTASSIDDLGALLSGSAA